MVESSLAGEIEEREGTAFHEAGHAAMALLLGRQPRSASIVQNAESAGHVQFDDDLPDSAKNYLGKSDEKRAYIEMRLLITLAGPIAHDIREPGRDHDAGDDHHDKWAFEVLSDHWEATDEERRKWIEDLSYRCHTLLHDNWRLVEVVAKTLLERDTISGDELAEICQSAP